MSDSDFVDIGDRLVVKFAENVVGYAEIVGITQAGVHAVLKGNIHGEAYFLLPFHFKDNETIDGYGHHSQPLTGFSLGTDDSPGRKEENG